MSAPAIGLREAKPDAAVTIRAPHRAAFAGDAGADLVDALREAGAIPRSPAAERNGVVAGQALRSRLTSDGIPGAAARAPLAVAPEGLRRGVGARLIEAAHCTLRDRGVPLVPVAGDPACYRRFGFAASAAVGFRTPCDGPYLMNLRLLHDAPASGTLIYPAPFAKLS